MKKPAHAVHVYVSEVLEDAEFWVPPRWRRAGLTVERHTELSGNGYDLFFKSVQLKRVYINICKFYLKKKCTNIIIK